LPSASNTWRAEIELGVAETSLMASVKLCSEAFRPLLLSPSMLSMRSAWAAKASRRASVPLELRACCARYWS
jgi:hypothetical protein